MATTYYTFSGITSGPQTFKAGSRHTTADGYAAWSGVDALIVFKSWHGSDPVDGDQVTLCNSATGFYETREWRGTDWVAIGGVISSVAFNFPRSAITTSRKGYRDWNDIAAIAAIRDAGKDHPIDGDCVTLYDDTWTQTRYYKGDKWLEESIYFPGILSPAPTQPGIGDELKPNLPKRLRDW